MGRLLRAAAAGALLLSSSCASSELPAALATEPSERRESEPHLLPGPLSLESEIGGMNQEGVEARLEELRPRFIACVEQATARLSAIGGRVNVRMRVDRGGHVRWAYLSDTTLGDRDAETCVLELVKSRKWPKPKSGEGLAETSFEVEAADAPRMLPGPRASLFARQAGYATRSCRKGLPSGFVATAYLSAKGEVLAAGVAPPDETGEAASDCIVEALRGVRAAGLVATRDAPAKVSVRIP